MGGRANECVCRTPEARSTAGGRAHKVDAEESDGSLCPLAGLGEAVDIDGRIDDDERGRWVRRTARSSRQRGRLRHRDAERVVHCGGDAEAEAVPRRARGPRAQALADDEAIDPRVGCAGGGRHGGGRHERARQERHRRDVHASRGRRARGGRRE